MVLRERLILFLKNLVENVVYARNLGKSVHGINGKILDAHIYKASRTMAWGSLPPEYAFGDAEKSTEPNSSGDCCRWRDPSEA